MEPIQQILQQYEQALNASDAKAVLDLYSSDPVFMPQFAPAQVGRDAVRDTYEQIFQTIQLQVKFTTYEVEQMGELAYVRTSSSGTVTVLANQQTKTEGNNELFIFKHENGNWKIHRYLFASSQAPN
ncbi:YybH family protein [Pseudanabaena sp. PCC 6802]|uniref:YybH family protein n=1 Tax=Pseudanabaena sp. PCC 6802 TaxID=118173 RepID=UPI0003492EA5|nr:nuclear transport factor 2 family protein [Pseudanabaena sp. PCC 6802]